MALEIKEIIFINQTKLLSRKYYNVYRNLILFEKSVPVFTYFLVFQRSVTNTDVNDIFDNNEAAGAALKQIAHYGQNVRDKAFRRWSYGIIQNLIVYGTRSPPAYDLSRITINVTMHYTVSDILLDEKDVLNMATDMPNTLVRKVARETFGHADFVFAADAKELVTDYILQALRIDSGLASL